MKKDLSWYFNAVNTDMYATEDFNDEQINEILHGISDGLKDVSEYAKPYIPASDMRLIRHEMKKRGDFVSIIKKYKIE